MTENLTNENHFKIFKEEVLKHYEAFGLFDWELCITHKENKKTIASCHVNFISKSATINLNIAWGEDEITENELRRAAYHEVCELLLMELSYDYQMPLGNEERSDYIQKLRHDIINRLDHRYFK